MLSFYMICFRANLNFVIKTNYTSRIVLINNKTKYLYTNYKWNLLFEFELFNITKIITTNLKYLNKIILIFIKIKLKLFIYIYIYIIFVQISNIYHN